MKIIRLTAENIKRLRAVEITPDPAEPVVTISGRNEQGKTSVLDAIWFAIGGGSAMAETTRPVREGEDHASVTIDLGEIVVTRRWNATGSSTLKVENKEGLRFNSPQSLLDGLAGKLSFDPLGFSRLAPKEQAKILSGLVQFPVDLDALDGQRKALYEQRTLANREVAKVQGQLAALPVPAADLPTEENSAADIVQELQGAQATIATNASIRQQRNKAWEEVGREESFLKQTDSAIAELQVRLFELQNRKKEQLVSLEAAKKRAAVADVTVGGLIDPDLTEFQSRLSAVEKTNAAVRQAAKYRETADTLEQLQSVSKQLTERIQAIDTAKEEALKAAQFPIDGLAFDAEGVTYKGIPFSQCSAAERLRVSLAMAMALNPKLRVIRITDGSLLDDGNMEIIREMAREKDYQVWMEVVDTSGQLGVYIEDGEVKGQ